MAKEASRVAKRTPISDQLRSRLKVTGKDPDFEYRIVTDKPGRIDMFKEGGWEVVTKDSSEVIGDRRVATPTEEGSAKTVAVGHGEVGILMKIRKEFWEEDQAAKEARTKSELDAIMRKAKSDGLNGEIKLERD